MASEDSRKRDGCRKVHGLSDGSDTCHTGNTQMFAGTHHAHHRRELLERFGLRRFQWMLFEERHDRLIKVANRSDSPSAHILPMVIVSTIDVDPTAPEIGLQRVQDMHAPRSLRDDEFRLDLPAEPRRAVTEDRNTEAALAVYEPDDPLLVSWPFLLIARTERIVTGHVDHAIRMV